MKRLSIFVSASLLVAGSMSFSGCLAVLDAMEPDCGDGYAEGWEECDGADFYDQYCEDFGLPSGELQCNMDDCTIELHECLFDTGACGNGSCDAGENEWNCDSDCPPSSHCGDDSVNDENENCDGGDLDGVSCEYLGFAGGELTCHETCRFDITGCDQKKDGSACNEDWECINGVCDYDTFTTQGYCTGNCAVDSCEGGGECRDGNPRAGMWCYRPCGGGNPPCLDYQNCIDNICWN